MNDDTLRVLNKMTNTVARLLVIDDEDSNVEALEWILGNYRGIDDSADYTRAMDAESALKIMREGFIEEGQDPYNGIICDHNMGQMTGRQFLRATLGAVAEDIEYDRIREYGSFEQVAGLESTDRRFKENLRIVREIFEGDFDTYKQFVDHYQDPNNRTYVMFSSEAWNLRDPADILYEQVEYVTKEPDVDRANDEEVEAYVQSQGAIERRVIDIFVESELLDGTIAIEAMDGVEEMKLGVEIGDSFKDGQTKTYYEEGRTCYEDPRMYN